MTPSAWCAIALEMTYRSEEDVYEDLARITSEEGIELRVNRSIQAEGAFADTKADMNFRRFLGRGTENALVAVILLAMAHNVQKLHHKFQNGTAGRHRIPVKQAA